MWRGSDFDRLAQQRIFTERTWIDAQPGLVAQGRAICLFATQQMSPEYLVALTDRFYRVFVFIPCEAKAAWLHEIDRAGHRAYPYVVLVGREDSLERCRQLALADEPRLRGASIVHLDEAGPPDRLSQVQDLYDEANMFPQPRYFVAGAEKTVLTSVLVDAEGRVIGTTMYHHLARVGPGFEAIACGLNATIRPQRSQVARAVAERPRPLSLAAWLNAAAILQCRERFGVREIWSYPRANNRRAIAFHHELGAHERDDICCVCIEHRRAPPDRRHTGATSVQAGEAASEAAGPLATLIA